MTNLNKLIPGTEFESMKLEEIIKESKGGIFNNAAQVWNHTFYWHCLSPNGGGEPQGKVAEAINKYFGSFDSFKENLPKPQSQLLARVGHGLFKTKLVN